MLDNLSLFVHSSISTQQLSQPILFTAFSFLSDRNKAAIQTPIIGSQDVGREEGEKAGRKQEKETAGSKKDFFPV